MKYCFTTLAVGDYYLNNSIESYSKNCDRFSGDFSITTNEKFDANSRIIPNIFTLDKYESNIGGFSFFLNLKVLSLKFCLDKGYDYIIYTDADWRIKEGLTEDKLFNMFNHMEKNNIDMLFERPALIGVYKQNLSSCFFTEKLHDYHVFDHSKWDNAHVVNEQILVIKNSWKFRYFVMRWEQFLWYSIHNNIRNYPDGFDIGVSALEAEMNMDYLSFRHLLPECFEFHDKLGNLHTRF